MYTARDGQGGDSGGFSGGPTGPNYPQLPEGGDRDWSYMMRRTMQEIIPNLFLGPYASASKGRLDEMLTAGLTHVVCVRQQLENFIIKPNHPNHFHYLVVELADNSLVSIIPQIRQSNAFIHQALSQGGRVLVHGNGGISRAPTLVIAYLMAEYGVGQRVALDYVQDKRMSINPNSSFLNQLKEFEFILQAEHCNFVTKPLPTLSMMEGDPGKRTIDQVFIDDDEVDNDGSVRKVKITTGYQNDENGFNNGAFNYPGQNYPGQNDDDDESGGAMEVD